VTDTLIVYVDVDDTLVRSVGSKRIPMPRTVAHVRELFNQGATLYCWSTGGARYAQETAIELGIDQCFSGFLPKPHVIVDDQVVEDWRHTVQVHPLQASSFSFNEYRRQLDR
jgi:hypothetical protein